MVVRSAMSRRGGAASEFALFCQEHGISYLELSTFFSLFVGCLVFDIFVCAAEDDIADAAVYALAVIVSGSLLAFFMSLDLQGFYQLSNTSAADALGRTCVFDVVNVALCLIRIIFC